MRINSAVSSSRRSRQFIRCCITSAVSTPLTWVASHTLLRIAESASTRRSSRAVGTDNDRSPPEDAPLAYPRENGALLSIANWYVTAEGNLYTINGNDIALKPSGEIFVPAEARSPGLSFAYSLNSARAAGSSKEKKLIGEYERASDMPAASSACFRSTSRARKSSWTATSSRPREQARRHCYHRGVSNTLSIILEFARIDEPEEPYAFRFEPQDYTRRTAGGGLERLRIEWSRDLLGELAALRAPQPDPALVQKIGELLRRALRSAEWSTTEQEIARANEDGQQVLVTLRSTAAELYALPWELVTIGAAGKHLGELPWVVLRYEWPETETTAAEPSPRPGGGRILVAWSAAGGSVPIKEHLEAIERAYRGGSVEFDRERDVLAHANAQALGDALERATADGKPYAILHLLAHGGAVGSTYGLLLDGQGAAEVVDAGRSRRLLAPHASTLRLVVLAACDSGNTGALGNHLGSLAQGLHRSGLRSVVASRFPLSVAGSTSFTDTLYRSLLVDPGSLERAFVSARERLTRDATLDWASVQLYARASDGDDARPVVFRPYRGLEVFDRQHQWLFFGRDTDIDEAEQEITALRGSDTTRMYFISGASGSGKSSLARAGIVPRLASDFAATHVTRPDAEKAAPAGRPLLYILDQSEELFTALDHDRRIALVSRLHALATDTAGSVVVFTLRADFIGRLGEIVLPDGGRLDRLEADDTHRLFLPVMNHRSMVAAITGPAERVGLPLQDGLAEQLVDEVAGEPGSLPLLEFALDRLWHLRDPRQGLTHASYRSLGGAIGALLEREANAVLDAMSSEEQVETRRLLVQLVAIGDGQRSDTRRKRRLSELRPADAAVFDVVLARLSAARLVVTSGGAEPQVELAHEELIRRWRRLREWADADRQKWIEIERVRGWEHLLRGAQLDRAREARERYGEQLGEEALSHIQESEGVLEEEASRERRNQQQLRAALAVAIVVAILAIVFFVRAENAAAKATRAAEEATKAAMREKSAKEDAKEEKEAKERANEAAASELAANEKLSRKLRDEQGYRASLLAKTPRKKREAIRLGVISVGSSPVPPPFSALNGLATASLLGTRDLRLEGHSGEVVAVAFSADGQRIATASADNTARLWDATTGSTLHSLQGHKGKVVALAFSPDGRRIATASDDNTARLWDANTGSTLRSLEGHGGKVAAVAFSTDGQRIATASADATARLWDASTGSALHSLKGHSDKVVAVAFSADGQRIATASADATARLWDANTGSALHSLEGHKSMVIAVAFSPDGQRIATASADNTARLWDANTGSTLHSLKGHKSMVMSVAFSADGQRIATASDDTTARLWDANTGSTLHSLKGHDKPVVAVAFSPDGQRIATASFDNTARLWDANTGSTLHSLEGHKSMVIAVAFSADGQRVATASLDNTAHLWDVLREGVPLLGHNKSVVAVAFSADGQRIATASDDITARLWDVNTGSTLHSLEGHKSMVIAVAFSPDGQRIATASYDNTARLWDANTGSTLHSLKGHKSMVIAVAFSPDGQRIATASADSTARLWDATTGSTLHSLRGHDKPVVAVAFSADGQRIATASYDTTARLWDANTGSTLHPLEGHSGEVVAVAFSPDGQRLATASDDNTARLWDANTGSTLHSLEGHSDKVWAVAFSADGRRIATASDDSTARLWLAAPEAWLLRGCELLHGFDEYYDDEVAHICDPLL